jgi:hypothetical protein
MINAQINEQDMKDFNTKMKYIKMYATMGAAEAINTELDGIKEQATFNLYPLKGVSVARLELSIEAGWKMKSAQANSDYLIIGTLYNISPHAGFHEVGTGAHAASGYFGQNFYNKNNFIYPKNGKLLKFMYMGPPSNESSPDIQSKAGTTNEIFARYVEGQEPKKYLGNAILAQQSMLSNNIGTFIMNRIKIGIGSVF